MFLSLISFSRIFLCMAAQPSKLRLFWSSWRVGKRHNVAPINNLVAYVGRSFGKLPAPRSSIAFTASCNILCLQIEAPLSFYAYYLYDAVYQYAKALNKTLARGKNGTGRNVIRNLLNSTYESEYAWFIF